MHNNIFYCQVKTCDDLAMFIDEENTFSQRYILVMHLKKDILSGISEAVFEKIKHIFTSPPKMSVLIIDCEITMNLYEKMYIFDLCYVSDGARLFYEPEKRKAVKFMNMLFGPKVLNLKKPRKMVDKDFVDYGLANAEIKEENFCQTMVSELSDMITEVSKEQLYIIKKCMNSYKESYLLNQPPATELETEYFCKLAVQKSMDNIDL